MDKVTKLKLLDEARQRTLMLNADSAHILDHAAFMLKVRAKTIKADNPLHSMFPILIQIVEAMRDEQLQAALDILNGSSHEDKN